MVTVVPTYFKLEGRMGRSTVLKRGLLTALALSFVAIFFSVMRTSGQEPSSSDRPEQWEYLVVAGPTTTNFSGTGAGKTRKESNSGFAREGYVLEQHMDRFGANGWELVTVTAPPDPVFYFKRRKTSN
jgi:hypothetical protein